MNIQDYISDENGNLFSSEISTEGAMILFQKILNEAPVSKMLSACDGIQITSDSYMLVQSNEVKVRKVAKSKFGNWLNKKLNRTRTDVIYSFQISKENLQFNLINTINFQIKGIQINLNTILYCELTADQYRYMTDAMYDKLHDDRMKFLNKIATQPYEEINIPL